MSDALSGDEREALYEGLRALPEYEPTFERLQREEQERGVLDFKETPAVEPVEPPVDEPFVPIAVTYDEVPLIIIPLSFPFTIEGLAVRTISLRPPRLDFIQAVAAGDLARPDMIAEMAGLSVEAINAMRWPDAERVLSAAADLAPDLRG